uniref:Coiled-coil domain-containing protein 93 n=2 Tax=Clastoptera arizonana TaxID=38151 RepID=A0A1B6D2L0_9HEMI
MSTLAEALKSKSSKHLSVIINAEGEPVTVEARNDEEQNIKLHEITDLLLAAGYFRARIKGLSSFDKVVGGMTWCIDSCDVDIDVDLLFQENLTIGQRISLTEKIVAVLPKLKCPHRIEPHQIQGLDFIHIFPVIQWLIKHSIERRKEMCESYKDYAVKQFNQQYTMTKIKESSKLRKKLICSINKIQEKYRPLRRFCRTGPTPVDIKSRVESTLLEYGNFLLVEDGKASTTIINNTQQIQQEMRTKEIMSTMTSMPYQENHLTVGIVGHIVNQQAEEITKAVEYYIGLQAEKEASNTNQLRKLLEREVSLKNKKLEMKSKILEEYEILNKIRSICSQDYNSSKIIMEADQGVLRKLQELVLSNESLKRRELEFRGKCKNEMRELQQLVNEVEETDLPDVNFEEENRILNELSERVINARLLLGRKTRAISILQRQLDQVPSRAELAQYQRRFLELYCQVSAKHRETKQFFTLYNTLNDTHQYLNKELTLLNSILDNYSDAMSSSSRKEQFMNQFDAIVEGVKQNKFKVEQKRNDEKKVEDDLRLQLLELLDIQRQYVAALKQLSETVTK